MRVFLFAAVLLVGAALYCTFGNHLFSADASTWFIASFAAYLISVAFDPVAVPVSVRRRTAPAEPAPPAA